MKPIASTMTEINNLPGEEVEFTISEANKAWVMRSMADLYSNRELACAREYSTNAYDANKEKALRDGHKIAPIEVTLPSAINPYFTVADSGIGMSESVLKHTYTQFGESTKRDSDDFNGMLGFGSKAAVAYTNTFTVTSVQNGYKTVGVVSRRETDMGGYLLTLKVILSVATTEPDGTSVQIPVHNWMEFQRKAMDFYRFWPEGTVKINGSLSKPDVGDKVDENLYYNANVGTSYVVMNNVPYRIANPSALFPRGMSPISFVAYLETCSCDYAEGDHAQVEFTPSREDLKYSDHTKHHLHQIIDKFVEKSVGLAKKEISSADTHYGAYKAWSKWRDILGNSQVEDLSYKGAKFVDKFPVAGYRYDSMAHRYGTWTIDEWRVAHMSNSIIIGDFTPENLASSHKRKVKDWAKSKGISARYFIFTKSKTISSPWVSSDSVVSWERVKAEAPKAPRKPRSAQPVGWGRKAGSFDLITRQGRKSEQDVPDSKELYYVMVKDFNENYRSLPYILDSFDMDHNVVLLPANRKAKFLRFYPHAEEVIPMLRSKVRLDGPSLIDKDANDFMSLATKERSYLSRFNPASIKDPDIIRFINLCKKSQREHLSEYNKHLELAQMLGVSGFKPHQYDYYYKGYRTPLSDKYPLVVHLGYSAGLSDIYTYINAVYAARKEGKNV